jgi:PhoH-like ATPase
MEMISSNPEQKRFYLEGRKNLAVNEYVHCTFDGEFCNGMIYRHLKNGWFEKLDMKPHLASITPKSPEQIMIANSLVNKDIPLVSMIGRAGSGKTLLAIAAGIQQVLIKHEYRKLIITRPIMPVGKDLGYLPGDVNEKMA